MSMSELTVQDFFIVSKKKSKLPGYNIWSSKESLGYIIKSVHLLKTKTYFLLCLESGPKVRIMSIISEMDLRQNSLRRRSFMNIIVVSFLSQQTADGIDENCTTVNMTVSDSCMSLFMWLQNCFANQVFSPRKEGRTFMLLATVSTALPQCAWVLVLGHPNEKHIFHGHSRRVSDTREKINRFLPP